MSDHNPTEEKAKKRYSVCIQVYSSMFIEVEAENADEAKDLAENQASEPGLCWQCSDVLQVDSVGDVLEVTELNDEQ